MALHEWEEEPVPDDLSAWSNLLPAQPVAIALTVEPYVQHEGAAPFASDHELQL